MNARLPKGSVLATFVGGWGHAEPLLELASLASQHGSTVTFVGQRGVTPRLEALGYSTIVVGPDTLTSERAPLQRVDRDLERSVMRDHFVGRFARQRATSIATLLQDTNPSVVICDEVDFGALIAAEVQGIPCVTINVIAAGQLVSPAIIGATWNAVRGEHGLPPDHDGTRLGGTLQLAPFPASFRDPTLPTLPQWTPVRPAASSFASVPGHQRKPFIYATLGTVFNVESGNLLARIVDALSSSGVDGLVTTGPNIDRDELPEPAPGVSVEQFVAQQAVLGRCNAVVCHGGSGTLLAALALGVPVVVLPMGADQPDNADRCAALGCGIVLDASDATSNDIADAVNLVTHDDRFRRSAERLAAQARSQPSLEQIAGLRTLLKLDNHADPA